MNFNKVKSPSDGNISEMIKYIECMTIPGRAKHSINEPWFVVFDKEQILSNKKRLSKPGVYFLFLEGSIKYVGSSNQMRSRIYAHSYSGKIPFDETRCIEIAIQDRRQIMEYAYIQHYCPPFNKAWKPA